MRKVASLLIIYLLSAGLYGQNTTINESFESWPAPDWMNYKLSLGGEWVHTTLYASNLGYGGGNGAIHRINNDNCNNWLVSPKINVLSDNYSLKFFEKSNDLEFYVYAGVYISNASGNPTDGDFIALEESLQSDDYYIEHTIDLSAYAGQEVYIAFVYLGTWHVWYVDEVSVGPSSYTDGALIEIVNPTGIETTGMVEQVTVNVQNYGTETIDNLTIDWSVNGVSQTPFIISSLGLMQGEDINLEVGSFDFSSSGDYFLAFNLSIENDINATNDSIDGYYFVSEPKDIQLNQIHPEGYLPASGDQTVSFTVENTGDFMIDSLVFSWSINGIDQTDYVAASIDLQPGQKMTFDAGAFFFNDGLNEVSGYVSISADSQPDNNHYTSYVPVNTFWESFEGTSFPPEMWTANEYPYIDYFTPEPHGDLYYFSQSDDNYFGYVSDTIYTPLLNIESGDIINFWIENSAFFTADDKLVWKDGSTGEVHVIQDIDSELEDWEEVTIDISEAAGINYIGFTNAPSGGYGHFKLDLISSTANINQFEHDLGLLSFTFKNPIITETAHPFSVSLRNYGTQIINPSDYTLKLYNGNDELIEEYVGVTLQPWEETTLSISHTFSSIVNDEVYVLIDFTSDQKNTDNRSKTYPLNTVPNDVNIKDIGSKQFIDLQFPFNVGGDGFTLGTDDISQHLYYSDEFNSGGFIYGVTIYYEGLVLRDQELPLKLWVKQTDLETLSGGWIPVEEMQLVFDDTVQTYAGNGAIYIPFIEPILFTGFNNLAIQYYQYSPQWPYVGTRFWSEQDEAGPIRTIGLNDVYDLDPNNLPDFFNERTSFTASAFAMSPITESGAVSGFIVDENNNPLQDAKIAIENTGIVITSDENGMFTSPDLPYASYEFTASYQGYNDSIQTVMVNSETSTVDFTLFPLPVISIQGTVYGSNAPSVPLSNVSVMLDGYELYETATDENGVFLIDNVYGSKSYSLAFNRYGYDSYSETLDLSDESIILEDITLNQEFLSPYNVSAVAETNQSNIDWLSPITSEKVKLQNDVGNPSFSWTNEPFENVWLGNLFTNTGQITITSVEVYWDIYENVHDFVTLEIIDIQGNTIVFSKPFLTFNDSLMTIDLPNITLTDDFYAMVHWQDNEASTDPLTIDYSEGVENTAYIKYPDAEPSLLSDFVGSPSGSFHIRVNSLQLNENSEDNEDIYYNIFKGLADDLNNIPNSPALNDFPITVPEFTDLDWESNEDGEYIYGVEAIYSEGNSEITFSNRVEKITGLFDPVLQSVRFYPNPASTDLYLSGIEDAAITIYNPAGAVVYIGSISNSIEQLDVSAWKPGNYIVEVIDQKTKSKKIGNLIISH